MARENRNERAACLARGAALGLFACLITAVVRADEQRVVLPIAINQVPKGDFLVVLPEDDVLLKVSELEAAGVKHFAGTRTMIGGEEFVSLGSLTPDVSFALDQSALTLSLTVAPRFLGTTVVNMSVGRPPGITYSRDTSAFLNYSLNWRDLKKVDGFAEIGASFGGDLLYGSVARDSSGAFIRGLTNFTIDRREQLQRIVLGDTFGNTGELGGGLFLGGLTVARDYGLDPYFIRYPTLTLGGAVLTPSTADVYVNGVLVRREELPPGQFDLTNLQLTTGSGNVRIVIRDAFGQERLLTSPFYASTQVLAEGYQEYSYSAGARRDDLGTASADYDSAVFLGHHRFGLSDSVTPEARLEAGKELVSGGLGLAWRLPGGEFSVDLAGSRDHGQTGSAGSFSYRFVGRPVSIGVVVRRMSLHYANASLAAGHDRATLGVNGFAGLQLSSRLSLTAQYALSQMRDTQTSRNASLTANLTTQRLGSLFVSAGRMHLGGKSVNEAFVGYSLAFGANSTANVSYSEQQGVGTMNYSVQKPLPIGEGIGYQVSETTGGGTDLGVGRFQVQGPFGRYDVEYDHSPGGDTKNLGVTGGVVAIGGDILASRAITDAFALVRVPDVGGVMALANNQPVGRTDSSGDVLVPTLLPYYGNRIGIKDTDIPLDYAVGATEKTIAPPYRGGALVNFPVQRIQSIRGRMIVLAGTKELIPAFGQVTLSVTGRELVSPVGETGEFEFENLPPGQYKALVEFKEGTCTFTLRVPRSKEQFIDLGVVRCSAPELQGGGP